ncbi:EF-hand domain pair domain-containing protein [Ditylenchus destructor]|nr:EF-hand domain pair domain-containing protein [Ditylenchus destructor]
MRFVLLSALFLMCLHQALSECCGHTYIMDMFSECCGKGICNIFCCNCDCKKRTRKCSSDEFYNGNQCTCKSIEVGRYRRSQDSLGMSHNSTMEKFRQLDTNSDGGIDESEARVYFGRVKRSATVPFPRDEFLAMDQNGNGRIDPSEMDEELI